MAENNRGIWGQEIWRFGLDEEDTQSKHLQSVFQTNLKRCRLEKYLQLNPDKTEKSYILEVVHRYQNDHEYLEKVQLQKNSEVWGPLLEKIQAWCYIFLARWGLEETLRRGYSFEIAQEASLQIVQAHYPYDCDFDAWARKITHNACSKYMKRYRANTFAVVEALDFSMLEEWIQDSKNELNINLEDTVANKQVLYDALEKLSDNQRRVIWDFYFEGRTFPQIAADLNISVNTLYKRHFDALKQLRKYLR